MGRQAAAGESTGVISRLTKNLFGLKTGTIDSNKPNVSDPRRMPGYGVQQPEREVSVDKLNPLDDGATNNPSATTNRLGTESGTYARSILIEETVQQDRANLISDDRDERYLRI